MTSIAEEAPELGCVNAVVRADELVGAVRTIVDAVPSGPTIALGMTTCLPPPVVFRVR